MPATLAEWVITVAPWLTAVSLAVWSRRRSGMPTDPAQPTNH